jgi:hypothetical protein
MQKYTDVVTSARSGSAIPSASVTVKTSPAGATATIYSDDGITTQSNPLTTDSNGEFTFYAADGEYTLTVSGTGITSRTIGPIILHDPADSDDYMPSTDVSFTQSGTGAVAGNVQDELRRVIRPEHFGAEGDGTTDDAAALVLANTKATGQSTGGEIRFQSGKTYKVSSNVTFDSDVTLYFEDGARLTIDAGKTVTAPGAVISLGGVPYTGSGTFTALYGVLCLTPGGSLGIGTTNPNVHAGDDGTTVRVCSVYAQTAALFIGITNRTPTTGNSVVDFAGYSSQQSAPHDNLASIRVIFEGTTAGQLGARVGILTKKDADTEYSEKLMVHDHGDVLIRGGTGAVTSANRTGQATTATVLSICGTGTNGVIELVTPAADASGLIAGDLLFVHNLNTSGEKRVARIEALTTGSTANNRGGQLLFFTKGDGAALAECARFTDTGAFYLTDSVTAHQGTAIPAGGTAGAGLLVSSTANFGVFFGSGAPTLTAAKGSLYMRSDGSSTTTRAYVNTDGGTTWTHLVAGA